MDNNFGLDLQRVMRKVLDVKGLLLMPVLCFNRTILQLAGLRPTSVGMFYRFFHIFLN